MTDPRLDATLARAAEILDARKGTLHQSCDACIEKEDYLAGWRDAVRALLERPESEHDGGCSAGISKLPCKCSQRHRTEAIVKFCDAMLEESDT